MTARSAERMRRRRRENPEKFRAYEAARYAADPEGQRARVAAYRSDPENRRRANAQSAAWRAANREKYHAAVRRWEAEHPELKAHYQALRYARRKGNGGTHTLEQWQRKCAEYGNRCAYCGKDRPLTRDHVVPVSKGGTDDIANIIPACQLCNSKKRTRTPEEFLRIRAAERSAP